MERLNIGYIYRLPQYIKPLTQWSAKTKKVDLITQSSGALEILKQMVYESGNLYGLRSSCPSAKFLIRSLVDINDKYFTNEPLKRPKNHEINEIAYIANRFEVALLEEFRVLPVYIVTSKGPYSLDALTGIHEDLFPAELLQFVPDAEYDVEQAGKCLAFEVPTAAAFHLHRINERVLGVYWDVVTANAPRPKPSTIGSYLQKFEEMKKSDRKVKNALRGIKDLYRNPVIHPEESLSVQDAIELFGIIISAVSTMLKTICHNLTERSPTSVS